MKVKDIIKVIEDFAPLSIQEGWDNSGLCVGSPEDEVTSVLLGLDCTPELVDEAAACGADMIVTHHPLIFKGVRKITPDDRTGLAIIKAIKAGIAIYAAHTSADKVLSGVSGAMAARLGLKNVRILAPKENSLLKLAVYVPVEHADAVRSALFEAGCGSIGDYDSCSYNITGEGTFRAGDNCTPYCGEIGRLHTEKEIRIETVLPAYIKSRAIKAMLAVHPYEEPAYDIYPLQNEWPTTGTGIAA